MIRSLKRAVPPRHPDLKEFDDSGIGNESRKAATRSEARSRVFLERTGIQTLIACD